MRINRPEFERSLRSVFHEQFQTATLTYLRRLHSNAQEVVLKHGDGGKDIVVYDIGRVYACYAPARIKEDWDENHLIRKIDSDFKKASQDLGDALKQWIFLHNHPQNALTNRVSSHLLSLKDSHPEIKIEAWGIEQLWEELESPRQRFVTPDIAIRGVGSFRKTLFDSSEIEAREIFVEPEVQLMSIMYGDSQFDVDRAYNALDHWIRWTLETPSNRRSPLVLLGPFGSGKSMLFGNLFERLASDEKMPVPVAVTLKNLRHAESAEAIGEHLLESIFQGSPYDPDDESTNYCLICDGFDELNLHYHDHRNWIVKAFRSLRALMELRPNIILAISSRPILVWGPGQTRAGLGPIMDLALQPFDNVRITSWCEKYCQSSGQSKSALNVSFLQTKKLLEVARNPLVLFMIAEMLAQHPDYFGENRRYRLAEVYRKFIDWTVTDGAYRSNEPKHRLPEQFREILGEAAWYAFETGEDLMRESLLLDHLRQQYGMEIDEIPIDRHLLNAHMLQPAVGSALEPGSTRLSLIEFTHLSFREYLTAEQIWRELLVAEQLPSGEAASRWRKLSKRLPGKSEFDFLRDFIALSPDDTKDRLHQTCSEFVHPTHSLNIFHSLARANGEDIKISKEMEASTVVACIAFFVCLNTCSERRSVKASNLSTILHWDLALKPERESHEHLSAFLSSLCELELNGGHIVNHNISNADFSGCRINEVRFHQCTLNDLVLRDADLENSSFEHCTMWFRDLRHAKFNGASFMGSRWEFIDDLDLYGGDFTGVIFNDSTLGDPRIEGATFVGNSWLNARVVRMGLVNEWVLKRCRIDLSAAQFFSEHGVKLIDCELDPTLPNSYNLALNDSLMELEVPADGRAMILLLNERMPSDFPSELLARFPQLEPVLHLGWLHDDVVETVLARGDSETLVIFPTSTIDTTNPIRSALARNRMPESLRILPLHLPGSQSNEFKEFDYLDFTKSTGRPWLEFTQRIQHWL